MPETLPLLSNLESPTASGAGNLAPTAPAAGGEIPPSVPFAGIVAELMEAVAALQGDGEPAAGTLTEPGKPAEILPGGGNALPPDPLMAVPLPIAASEAAPLAVAAEGGEADLALATLTMVPTARAPAAGANANALSAAFAGATPPAPPAMPRPDLIDAAATAGAAPVPVALPRAAAGPEPAGALLAVPDRAPEASAKIEPSLPTLAPTFASTPAPSADGTLRSEIAVPFRQPGWDEALGNRVVWLAGQQVKSAELHLNPPELGPIDVQIHVTDNETHIEFGASQAVVREAIEAALPKLREMLSASGLTLADVNVSQQWLAHGRQQSANGEAPRQFAERDGHVPAAAQALPLPARHGLVDLYA